MKPHLPYHPRTIGQAIRFALLGIRAAASAARWLFLRADESQLSAHEVGDPRAFAAASVELATVRLVIIDLEQARSHLLTMRDSLHRRSRLDRGPGGVPIDVSAVNEGDSTHG